VRWLRFSTVGALGIGAQLAALAFFHGALGLNYLGATALAVEFAILHNFTWHECWTWRDRAGCGSAAFRLLRFQCASGAVSLVFNVAGMRLFAGVCRLPYLAANLLCIAAGAAANFVAADRFAFRTARA
jgi:putative flippase GtrA